MCVSLDVQHTYTAGTHLHNFLCLQTNRFIDVDFNCLDANVNLQTWVVLLDFLGMGAKIPDASQLEKGADNGNQSLSLSGKTHHISFMESAQ